MTPTHFKIFACLSENPESTATQVVALLGLPNRTVQRNLREMLDLKIIHISAYHKHHPGRGRVARAYSVGNKPPARRPQTSAADQLAARLERQRNKRRLQAIKERAKGSPFGVLVAQLTLEKRV